MAANRILLVEDHQELAETVGAYLEASDYVVDYATDGNAAVRLAGAETFDAIVLDIMLPGMDGIAVCQHLRNQQMLTTPVIMLTARDQLQDKLTGFEVGADDYLVKPFDMPELVARIEALVRRSRGIATQYSVGELSLDAKSFEVVRAGRPVELSKTAFEILKILMREYPNIVSRAELEHGLWGDNPPDSDALRSHLYNLRQAVDRPFANAMIQTLPGRGYRIRPDS